MKIKKCMTHQNLSMTRSTQVKSIRIVSFCRSCQGLELVSFFFINIVIYLFNWICRCSWKLGFPACWRRGREGTLFSSPCPRIARKPHGDWGAGRARSPPSYIVWRTVVWGWGFQSRNIFQRPSCQSQKGKLHIFI